MWPSFAHYDIAHHTLLSQTMVNTPAENRHTLPPIPSTYVPCTADHDEVCQMIYSANWGGWGSVSSTDISTDHTGHLYIEYINGELVPIPLMYRKIPTSIETPVIYHHGVAVTSIRMYSAETGSRMTDYFPLRSDWDIARHHRGTHINLTPYGIFVFSAYKEIPGREPICPDHPVDIDTYDISALIKWQLRGRNKGWRLTYIPWRAITRAYIEMQPLDIPPLFT